MRTAAFLVVFLLTIATMASAATPSKCFDALPAFLARITAKHFVDDAATAETVRDNIYADFGALKRAAEGKSDPAIATFFADREGIYDYLATQAEAEHLPVWQYVGRQIKCVNVLDLREVIYRNKGTAGVIHDVRAAKVVELSKRKPGTIDLAKFYKRDLELLRDQHTESF